MAHFFRIMGRLAGRAIKSHAFDRTMTIAARYITSEVKLGDLKAKRALLKRKYASHICLLGRTVYRLLLNDINPLNDENIRRITSVLEEINREIQIVEEKLEKRRETLKERSAQQRNHRPHRGEGGRRNQ